MVLVVQKAAWIIIKENKQKFKRRIRLYIVKYKKKIRHKVIYNYYHGDYIITEVIIILKELSS